MRKFQQPKAEYAKTKFIMPTGTAFFTGGTSSSSMSAGGDVKSKQFSIGASNGPKFGLGGGYGVSSQVRTYLM